MLLDRRNIPRVSSLSVCKQYKINQRHTTYTTFLTCFQSHFKMTIITSATFPFLSKKPLATKCIEKSNRDTLSWVKNG